LRTAEGERVVAVAHLADAGEEAGDGVEGDIDGNSDGA